MTAALSILMGAAVMVGVLIVPWLQPHIVIPWTRKSRGLRARLQMPLEWQQTDYRQLSEITGRALEWLNENEVDLWSSNSAEEFILSNRCFPGDPFPRPYQLWTRHKGSPTWHDWGQFEKLPATWIVNFRRNKNA